MKKVTAGLVILLTAVTVSTAAQRVELGTITDDLQVTVIEANDFRTVVRFEISAFTKETVEIGRETYYNIYCSNEGILLNKGEPALPRICRAIIIPDEAKMKIRVLESEYHDFPATPVAPSKGNLPRTINPNDVPYTFGSIYSLDKWYPSSLASMREPFILRDFRGTVIELNAF
ncbi:MAG: hypothetical protein DRP26_07310 [Candidatus Zixiibacteriota bacterium]|nr:MAG: hypothetical protein DRP26_07310 [candidate division Zixibacteria bacterium]